MLKLVFLIVAFTLLGAFCYAQDISSDAELSRDTLVSMIRNEHITGESVAIPAFLSDPATYQYLTYGPSYGPVTVIYDRHDNVRYIYTSHIADVITRSATYFYKNDTLIYAHEYEFNASRIVTGDQIITVDYYLSGGKYISTVSPNEVAVAVPGLRISDALLAEAKEMIRKRAPAPIGK